MQLNLYLDADAAVEVEVVSELADADTEAVESVVEFMNDYAAVEMVAV